MKLAIIAAVALNRVIGKKGKLPWHIPEDLKYFREVTMGHAVIMGRKTFESLGKPLPKRTNLVLSKSKFFNPAGTIVVPNIHQAVQIANRAGHEKVFFIGGQRVFEEAIGIVNTMYITRVYANYYGDRFFPEFSLIEWTIKCSGKKISIRDEYQHLIHERI